MIEATVTVASQRCFSHVFEVEPVNTFRFAFLDPRATRLYCTWKGAHETRLSR